MDALDLFIGLIINVLFLYPYIMVLNLLATCLCAMVDYVLFSMPYIMCHG
jgi:hypothetical protein